MPSIDVFLQFGGMSPGQMITRMDIGLRPRFVA